MSRRADLVSLLRKRGETFAVCARDNNGWGNDARMCFDAVAEIDQLESRVSRLECALSEIVHARDLSGHKLHDWLDSAAERRVLAALEDVPNE